MQEFNESLKIGFKGEELVAKQLISDYENIGMYYEFEPANMKQDKKGIDFFLVSNIEKPISFQVKTQTYNTRRFGCFLFEIKSCVEHDDVGWFELDNADEFIYCWLMPNQNELYEMYSIQLSVVYKLYTEGKLYFSKILHSPMTIGKHEIYHSLCITVPINYLIQIGLCDLLYKRC